MVEDMETVKAKISVQEFCEKLDLEVLYAGRQVMEFDNISVSRPGLQLAGFFKYFDSSRVQVIGNSEHEYMLNMQPEKRQKALDKLFAFSDIPCVILARELPVMEELMHSAMNAECPVLRSRKITSILINDLVMFLNRLLAPSVTMHGVLLDVYGAGILLTGHSGIGKSETALELVKRGHRLVADDAVYIKKTAEQLIGSSNDMIRYFMEIRGIGIINVKNMYGTGSVMYEKEVELVIELEDWKEGKQYDRLGDETMYETILGVKKPKLTIPVKPGRNLAIIIEVAARNYRLKCMGYDAAQELISKTNF